MALLGLAPPPMRIAPDAADKVAQYFGARRMMGGSPPPGIFFPPTPSWQRWPTTAPHTSRARPARLHRHHDHHRDHRG